MSIISKHERQAETNTPGYKTSVVGLVGPGAEFEGKLKASSGTVVLNSIFKGIVNSEYTIVIGDNGDVEGDLSAKVITVSGKLKGSAKASERLEINAHGVVLGDVFTPVLVVEPGGYLEGQCHMPIPEQQKATPKGEPAAEVGL